MCNTRPRQIGHLFFLLGEGLGGSIILIWLTLGVFRVSYGDCYLHLCSALSLPSSKHRAPLAPTWPQRHIVPLSWRHAAGFLKPLRSSGVGGLRDGKNTGFSKQATLSPTESEGQLWFLF